MRSWSSCSEATIPGAPCRAPPAALEKYFFLRSTLKRNSRRGDADSRDSPAWSQRQRETQGMIRGSRLRWGERTRPNCPV
jgi:hypothetical protein